MAGFDKEENIRRAAEPQPGDYWHECFMPVALVLQAGPFSVSYLHRQKAAGSDGRWTWDTADVATKSRKEFQAWLSYGSIPGTWAAVVPNWKHWSEFADDAARAAGGAAEREGK
jgi:hypothetical protein